MSDLSQRPRPKYHRVNGINYCSVFTDDNVWSALNYQAKPDDVFMVTHPKSGTHWTFQMIFLIRNDGQLQRNIEEFDRKCVIFEINANEIIKRDEPTYVLHLHQRFQNVPYHPHAKYVMVVRNPFDVCVSYYHHTKMFPQYEFDGTFDDWFEVFMNEDDCEIGGYFNHLDSLWPRRNDSNVHLTMYEAMKSDLKGEVLKMAKFLDYRKHEKMLHDPTYLNNVVSGCTFPSMQENVGQSRMEQYNITGKDDTSKPQFIRKGSVGGWKNYFNEEQEEALRTKFLERAGDKVSLWGDLCTWI